MRRMTAFALFLAALSRAAFCQESDADHTAVTLQNQENAVFYFVMDPPDLSGITASSPLLESEVALFFSKETETFPFSPIQPKASITLKGLSEGMHLLVGFFAMEERIEFPVRIISVQVDTKLGARTYELYSEPALLNPARGLGKLASFGATPSPQAVLSGKPEEKPAAEEKPAEPSAATSAPAPEIAKLYDIAAFPVSYEPAVFTREKEKTFTVLPIEDAGYWNRNGTRIASLSGSITEQAIGFEIKSVSGFSTNVSYFMYLFSNRNLGVENKYTLEIIPVLEGRSKGLALLWIKGRDAPLAFGSLAVEGSILRVVADTSTLPQDFVSLLIPGTSADVTACFFDEDARTYEEFFYKTFSLSAIESATR